LWPNENHFLPGNAPKKRDTCCASTKESLIENCRKFASVVEIEIQEVPMHQEPEEAHTTNSQQSVPNLVPNPLLLIAPKLNRGDDRDERAESSEHSDELPKMNFHIAACT